MPNFFELTGLSRSAVVTDVCPDHLHIINYINGEKKEVILLSFDLKTLLYFLQNLDFDTENREKIELFTIGLLGSIALQRNLQSHNQPQEDGGITHLHEQDRGISFQL